MTPKPKLKVDWPNVVRGFLYLLTGLGVVGTGYVTLAPNNSDASEVMPVLTTHMATDSVRWVYTEKRLERIESLLLRIDEKIDERPER